VTSATTNHPELPAPKWISSTSTNNTVTFTHFSANQTVNNTFIITIPNPYAYTFAVSDDFFLKRSQLF